MATRARIRIERRPEAVIRSVLNGLNLLKPRLPVGKIGLLRRCESGYEIPAPGDPVRGPGSRAVFCPCTTKTKASTRVSMDRLRRISVRFDPTFVLPAASPRLPGRTSRLLFMALSPLIFAGWEFVTANRGLVSQAVLGLLSGTFAGDSNFAAYGIRFRTLKASDLRDSFGSRGKTGWQYCRIPVPMRVMGRMARAEPGNQKSGIDRPAARFVAHGLSVSCSVERGSNLLRKVLSATYPLTVAAHRIRVTDRAF